MSTRLGPLYHWSPRDRLNSIKRYGLLPGKRNIRGPVWHGNETNPNIDNNEDIGEGEFLQRGICFAPDPATAWDLSHRIFDVPGTYDLWQVVLEESDEVHILPQWGARIWEVRVFNRIYKRRLIWVGERTILPPD